MVLLLCGCLCVGGMRRGQCCCLVSGVLSRRKPSPDTCLEARHFNFPLFSSSVLLAAPPVLKSQSERVCVSRKSTAGPLNGDSCEFHIFLAAQPPLFFFQPEVMKTYLSGTGTLSWWSCMGPGSLTPEVSLPIFITTHRCGMARCTSLCLCTSVPLHLSLHLLIPIPPICLNECDFFNSLVVGFPYSSIF